MRRESLRMPVYDNCFAVSNSYRRSLCFIIIDLVALILSYFAVSRTKSKTGLLPVLMENYQRHLNFQLPIRLFYKQLVHNKLYSNMRMKLATEPVVQRCSVKKVFLEIL